MSPLIPPGQGQPWCCWGLCILRCVLSHYGYLTNSPYPPYSTRPGTAMVLLGTLGILRGLIKVKHQVDIDSSVFKLHYRITATILFTFCILITCTSLLGEPMKWVIKIASHQPMKWVVKIASHQPMKWVVRTASHQLMKPLYSVSRKNALDFFKCWYWLLVQQLNLKLLMANAIISCKCIFREQSFLISCRFFPILN